MTFDATEKSIRSASPVELYEFSSQYNRYLYSTSSEDAVVTPDIFEALPISRSKIVLESEVNKANITIKVPFESEIAQIFAIQPPPNPVTIAIYRYHVLDGIGNKILYWSGRILSSRWKEEWVEFSCESIYTSIQRHGVTRTYQPSCPYALYQGRCPANPGSFVVVEDVDTVVGSTLTISALTQDDHYFSGGYLEYAITGSLTEFRSIIGQVGTTINLGYSIPALSDGDEVKLYPGCERSLDHCYNKFSVGEDFGGFPWVPGTNPFNGAMLF